MPLRDRQGPALGPCVLARPSLHSTSTYPCNAAHHQSVSASRDMTSTSREDGRGAPRRRFLSGKPPKVRQASRHTTAPIPVRLVLASMRRQMSWLPHYSSRISRCTGRLGTREPCTIPRVDLLCCIPCWPPSLAPPRRDRGDPGDLHWFAHLFRLAWGRVRT